MAEEVFQPEEGDFVYDTTRGTVGRVMEMGIRRAYLRPVLGGREWDIHLADLRRPTEAELAQAKRRTTLVKPLAGAQGNL